MLTNIIAAIISWWLYIYIMYQLIKWYTSSVCNVYVNKAEENVVYSPKVFVGMQECNILRRRTIETWSKSPGVRLRFWGIWEDFEIGYLVLGIWPCVHITDCKGPQPSTCSQRDSWSKKINTVMQPYSKYTT